MDFSGPFMSTDPSALHRSAFTMVSMGLYGSFDKKLILNSFTVDREALDF